MTAWDFINILGRVILTGMAIVKITRFRGTLNCVERMGLGCLGAGSFLTIGAFVPYPPPPGNPFEGWTVALLTYGIVILLAGRTYRDWRHDQNNTRQILHAREWIQQRNSRG